MNKVSHPPTSKATDTQKSQAPDHGLHVVSSDAVEPGDYKRPSIVINTHQLWEVSEACLRALLASNDPPYLFARGGEPVHITADEHELRKRIQGVSPAYLGGQLTRTADFYTATRDGLLPANPPKRAVEDLLSRPITEWSLLPLLGLTETPILRPNGTVVTASGYDAETRMVYDPAPDLVIPPIPEHPTQSDASRAAVTVIDVINEFPWVDDASFTNAMGLLLTPILRPIIRGRVPIALIDAHQQGTGKGLLVEVVSIIATGSTAGLRAAPKGDDDEWRKSLTALIYAGHQLSIFDNVTDTLKSDALAAVVTAENWTDRLLGHTTTLTMPQQTIFVVTGNNITLGGDLARRSYWIRLDAKMPRPFEGRKFKYPYLKKHVMENRGRFLGALLTMCSAWYRAGQPASDTPLLGSFEEWTRIVGGILDYAGFTSFLGNRNCLYQESDVSEAQWVAWLRTLRESFGDHSFATRDVTPISRLRETMPDEIRNPQDPREVGRVLRKRIGKRHGKEGLYVEQDDGKTDNVARWFVRTSG